MFNFKKSLFVAMMTITCSLFAQQDAGGAGGVDDFGMEDHSINCESFNNMQTLTVADFNGDGFVNGRDVKLVSRAVGQYKKGSVEKNLQTFTNGEDNNAAYIVLYDIDNNGILDEQDILVTKSQLGLESTELDQQVVRLYKFAIQYPTMSAALKAGYMPFTQEYQNHGVHLLRFPQFAPTINEAGQPDLELVGDNILDGTFEHDRPEGLNFDRYGNLVAVFYYIGPDIEILMKPEIKKAFGMPVSQAELAAQNQEFYEWYKGVRFNGEVLGKPEGFVDLPLDVDTLTGIAGRQDHWHFHHSICQRNTFQVLGAAGQLIAAAGADPVSDADILGIADQLDTRQCDLLGECQRVGGVFIPRFYMLHVWLFNRNNRCGAMWGTHEDVSDNDVSPEIQSTIASENASFIFQAGTETLEGEYETDHDGNVVPKRNRNYRELCLNIDEPAVDAAGNIITLPGTPIPMPVMWTLGYEDRAGDPARNLPPLLSVRNYINSTPERAENFKDTLVCAPTTDISGPGSQGQDEGCTLQYRDENPLP